MPWCGDHDFELDYADHIAPNQFEIGFANGMCLDVVYRDGLV